MHPLRHAIQSAAVTAPALVALLAIVPGTHAGGPEIECPGQCMGDRDNTARIDGADLATVLGAWGTESPCDDLNSDGTVDGGDVAIILSAWGDCPSFGACCLESLSCIDTSVYDCQTVRGGTFMGNDSSCGGQSCVVELAPQGACCLYDTGACIQVSAEECEAVNGSFAGEGTSCEGAGCCTCMGSPETCASVDCDGNGVVDACEIADGQAGDCNGDGIPDSCETDCDANGVPDACEEFADCNANGIFDACEGPETDLDGNLVPDECDIAAGRFADCDGNGVPDALDADAADCNGNGVPDLCELASRVSADCNGNGVPDECESLADCDGDGTPDACETGEADCNGNGIPDGCELRGGDLDNNGLLDECEFGCAPDIDVDSDNSGAIEGTSLEDALESLHPGKLLLAPARDETAPLVPIALSAGCARGVPALWSVSYPEDALEIFADPAGTVVVPSEVEAPAPPPPMLWMRAVAASASANGSHGFDVVLTVREPSPLAGPAKKAKDAVKVKVVKPSIAALTFDGPALHYVLSDTQDQAVPRPQWKPSQGGEPFLLVREGANGAIRSVVADFKAEDDFTGEMRVKATSNHSIKVDETDITFKDGVANGVKLTLSAVPDSVARFTDFEFTWTFKPKGGEFGAPVRTSHLVYVTASMPRLDLLVGRKFDRLYVAYLHFTCDWAAGKKEPDEVLEAIWTKVKTRTATPYGYYCPVVPEAINRFNSLDLLGDWNGRCGQWATFFVRLGEAHGIDLNVLQVLSDYSDGATKYPGLKVKNFKIANVNVPRWEGNHESKKGIPGQTPPETTPAAPGDPPCDTPHLKEFGDHAVTYLITQQNPLKIRIFDPSYGTSFGPDAPDAAYLKLDDASIAFFVAPSRLMKVNGSVVRGSPWHSNPQGVNNITVKPFPR